MSVSSTVQEPSSDGQVIVVRAAKTAQQSRRLRQTLMEATAGTPRHVIIDLRQTDDISAQALAALIGVRSRQIAKQRELTVVCAPGSDTERALGWTGMRERFTTVSQLPADSRDLAGGGR
jgi:anti-anti-sigma regulatory factor